MTVNHECELLIRLADQGCGYKKRLAVYAVIRIAFRKPCPVFVEEAFGYAVLMAVSPDGEATFLLIL